MPNASRTLDSATGSSVELREVGERQPPTRLGRAVAQLDQPQEHLHRNLPLVIGQGTVESLCAPREHAPDPAERAVAVQRQGRPRSAGRRAR